MPSIIEIQYMGVDPIRESRYFGREIKQGFTACVKSDAAKELLKSKDWVKVKPEKTERIKKDGETKDSGTIGTGKGQSRGTEAED